MYILCIDWNIKILSNILFLTISFMQLNKDVQKMVNVRVVVTTAVKLYNLKEDETFLTRRKTISFYTRRLMHGVH